jgi:hypothetical protein
MATLATLSLLRSLKKTDRPWKTGRFGKTDILVCHDSLQISDQNPNSQKTRTTRIPSP